MVIRDARAADLPAIVSIYNAAIPDRMATADTEAVTVEGRRPWFAAHGPGARPLWVAEEDRSIAGWLSFQSFYGRPAYHATAEVSIYVAPSHRRRGVARRFLVEAIARSPGLGLSTLLGFIFTHNTPSLALFLAQGFEQWGYLPRVAELDAIWRDLAIVGRAI